MNFKDEMGELEQKAKDEGWDKKAEEEMKQRMMNKNNQPNGQQPNTPQ